MPRIRLLPYYLRIVPVGAARPVGLRRRLIEDFGCRQRPVAIPAGLDDGGELLAEVT